MMKYLFTVVFCFCVMILFGQTVPPVSGTADGDYYSGQSGLWSDVNIWYRWDAIGGIWVNPASVAPSNDNAAAITIASPHIVQVAAEIFTDQTIVQSGATLLISAGGILRVEAGDGIDLLINGTVQINNANLRANASTSLISVNGTINNAGTISNTNASRLVFNAGSIYNHENTTPGVIPVAGWDVGSLCRITADVADRPGNLAQAFGNFEWNTPVLVSDVDLNGELDDVKGDLIFTNTGSSQVYLSQGSGTPINLVIGGELRIGANASTYFTLNDNVTVTVGSGFVYESLSSVGSEGVGNVSINVSGDVNFNSGVFNSGLSTGATSIGIAGDYTNSGTTLTRTTGTAPLGIIFNGGANHNFTSTFVPTFPVNYTTTTAGSNLIIEKSSFLAGPGDLNVGTGTSISLLSEASSGALQNGAVGGNVQVTGTRTYDGTIVYNGAATQYMSTQHPDEDTKINNANHVFMVGDVTFATGVLDLDNGTLLIDEDGIAPYTTLTIETILQNGGFIGINSGSSLVINGTGNFGDLVLFHQSGLSMRNLTINRDGGTVGQATAELEILGTLNLAAGDFSLGSNTTRLFGPLEFNGGTLSSTNASTLEIRGSGSIPADILIGGGAINTLRMDRDGETFNTSSTLIINTLRLAAGSVNNSGNTLSMADGGLINRTFGDLLTPIGNVGTYNLRYGGVNGPISTGPELPASPARDGVLDNFTVDNEFNVTNPNPGPGPNAHTLTLISAIDAAGDFVITEGRVDTGGNDMNIGGDLTISTNGTIVPGTSTFTFDGGGLQTITSVPVLALTDVAVNKTGSELTLASAMTISNSFAVNSATIVNLGSNQLTLLSTSGATAFIPAVASGATINGSIIAQRNLPTNTSVAAYRYLAPGVTGSNVQDWKNEFPITGTFSDPSTGTGIISGNPSMYIYDETSNTGASTQEARYVNYPSSGLASEAALENGRGYAVWIRGDGATPFDTRGGVRVGNFSVPVSNSGGGVNDGYNLIGNPYPAPIDWTLVNAASTGIDNAIYLTDNTMNEDGGTRKVSFVGGVGVPETYDGLIAQGQGFWVHAGSGGGSVNFAEAHKVAGQTNFLREGEIPNLLYVKMKKNSTIDQIAIRLHEDATDAFDGKWDAFQFGASGLRLSSLTNDNRKLAINSIRSLGCDNTVPLQIDGGVTGSYTFDFTGLETFEPNVTLYLNDKVLNKQVALSTTPQYAFTVSDVATLKNRFEIFIDRPSVETAIAVAGESVCENNGLAYITLQNSQANVNYSAQWNSQTLSGEIMGNGGQIQIPVPVEILTQGEHEFTILAKMTNCDAVLLENRATLTVVKKGVIEHVEDGSSCEEGQVVIKAFSDGTEVYNWYEDVGSTTPVAGQNTATFTTSVLNKTKTYYVAAVNSMGCEGERVAVKANVTLLEDVTIEVQGVTLTSSYETGNQWYLDGLLIDNATTNQIEATISGTYSVVATVDGCTTSAAREMVVTGMSESRADFITIYPNPATEKVLVEVKSVNPSLQAKLMSPIGVELNTMALRGESEIKSGEFDLMSYPTGMYMVRVIDGKKVYTIKISKVK